MASQKRFPPEVRERAMTAGTPKDYSDAMYNVYFEIGEWEGAALGVLETFVGPARSKSIKRQKFGYELAIPIQCIPDIVRRLVDNNIAVYQIVRGERINASWREPS